MQNYRAWISVLGMVTIGFLTQGCDAFREAEGRCATTGRFDSSANTFGEVSNTCVEILDVLEERCVETFRGFTESRREYCDTAITESPGAFSLEILHDCDARCAAAATAADAGIETDGGVSAGSETVWDVVTPDVIESLLEDHSEDDSIAVERR